MDRRNEKTKNSLCTALISLTETTPYDVISVTALCKKANVSRSTFYLNYDNIYSLREEIQADFIAGLSFDTMDYTFEKKDSERAMQYIIDNEDVFQFLCKYGTIKQFFVEHISRMIQEIVFQTNIRDIRITCDVASTYLVNGSLSIMNYYLENGIKMSAYDMTNIIYNLVRESFPIIKKTFVSEQK